MLHCTIERRKLVKSRLAFGGDARLVSSLNCLRNGGKVR